MNHQKIVDKWQQRWDEAKLFQVKKSSKPKYYVLEMFPYPSGYGLHVGHAFNYTIGDIYSRFKKMQGFNVFHPMGFDSFGLPAENAANKEGIHPKKYTEDSINNFVKEFKSLGLSYDWSREVRTHSPEYYKWDQWIFLEMYKKGLAYKKKSAVNWCPKCETVLANEQVIDGMCWRNAHAKVEIKQLSQWYLKITEYAKELNDGLDKLKDWPELVKKLQRNWIGESEGTQILFEINGKNWPIFTTRPDTLYGVTFLVVAATHPKLDELVKKEQKIEVANFLKKLRSVSEEDIDKLEKEGVFTGSYATHPLTGEKVPVFAGNFVVADYGSGMVMAVPAHDQRDYEFAKKYDISLKEVISSKEGIAKSAYTGEGKLVNSQEFNGKKSQDAKKLITKKLAKLNKGKHTIQYRLRDWLISRQRYWGTPIPIYYDNKGEPHPVDKKDLPIKLPEDVKFGKGNPLETSKKHYYKKKGKKYKLETDTMDTFVNSSWYQLRYTAPNNNKKIFGKDVNYWNPVDLYIGGKEHACMHLIYIRFYTKFLRDLGLLDFDEPAIKLFNQGYIQGEDGFKMSKSRGNVVTLKQATKKYGLDAMRLFIVSVASPDKDINWSDRGAEGASRFLTKVMTYSDKVKIGKSSQKLKSKIHKAIRDYTQDIQDLKYNLAAIKLRELFGNLEQEISKEDYETFLKLLAPICPHIAEELWEKMGNKNFIAESTWPKFNKKFIDEKSEYFDELIQNLRQDIIDVTELIKIEPKNIRIILADDWKYQFAEQMKKTLKKTHSPKEIIPKIMQTKLKSHGKQIIKLIPAIIKDESKLPKFNITRKEELNNLQNNVENLYKEFGAEIRIVVAEDSDENKANQAFPTKPAIIIK